MLQTLNPNEIGNPLAFPDTGVAELVTPAEKRRAGCLGSTGQRQRTYYYPRLKFGVGFLPRRKENGPSILSAGPAT